MLKTGFLGLLTLLCAGIFQYSIAQVSTDTLIIIQPQKDNSLYQSGSSLSNGAGVNLFSGRTNNGSQRRALLKFDLIGSIPFNATIDSVNLRINVNRRRGGSHPFNIHQLIRDWGEQNSVAGGAGGQGGSAVNGDATWTHSFWPDTLWTTQGGDFNSNSLSGLNISSTGPATFPNSTAFTHAVDSLFRNPISDFGFIIIGNESSNGTAMRFNSSESGSLRPELRVYCSVGCSFTSSESITSCGPFTWPVNGVTYTQSGVYQETVFNPACDSLFTLNLQIDNGSVSSQNVVACDSFNWSETGVTYFATGTYSTTLSNQNGCDSTLTLNLTVNQSNTGLENITACSDYTWPANGITYQSSGVYNAVLTNSGGCDSLVTLDLTINRDSSFENISACDAYTWQPTGITYTSSGVYDTTLTTSLGCDSVVTLNLTINSSISTTDTVSACNQFTWSNNGLTYSQSGMYVDTVSTTLGCDSILRLDLTIVNVDTSVSQSGLVLSSNQSNASYQWFDCDSGFAALAGEVNQSYTVTVSGSYSVVVDLNGCVDTSACINISVTDLEYFSFENEIRVYPNPSSGNVSIQMDKKYSTIKILVKDISGKQIANYYGQGDRLDLELPFEPGVYFFEIFNDHERAIERVLIE